MNPPPNLLRLVTWAHHALSQVLQLGDRAVDLTVGTGRDTLFLHRAVGATGTVIGFDLQDEAIWRADAFLQQEGIHARVWHTWEGSPIESSGVHLVRDDHARWDRWVGRPVRALIANLGYLPKGDPAVCTRPEASLAALETATGHLSPGGRLAVICYTGHPGGAEETRAVDAWFASLAPDRWRVLRLQTPQHAEVPLLLIGEKR